MKDGPANKTIQTETVPQDADFIKIVLLGLVAALAAITLSAGVNAAYFLLALGAAGVAILHINDLQEWANTHKMVWIGAMSGFFFAGASFGPIGMGFGAWLGHLVEQQINHTVKVVNKVAAPVTYAKQTTQSLWSSLQGGFDQAYQLVVGKEETPPKEVPTAKAMPILSEKRFPAAGNKSLPEKQKQKIEVTFRPTPTGPKMPLKKPQPPLNKKPVDHEVAKGGLWQTFSRFFTSQPAKTPQASVAKDPSKTLIWQQKSPQMIKADVPKVTPPQENKSTWLPPILSIM